MAIRAQQTRRISIDAAELFADTEIMTVMAAVVVLVLVSISLVANAQTGFGKNKGTKEE
jgi:hypothetical protein